MAEFFARHAFSELWALAWHFGIIGFVIVAALAWAWFVPIFKKTALWVALGALIIFFTAGIYTKLGADYVQAKWDAANIAAAQEATAARTAAEAAFPPDTREHPGRLPNDPWDRDQQNRSATGVRPTPDLLKFKRHR